MEAPGQVTTHERIQWLARLPESCHLVRVLQNSRCRRSSLERIIEYANANDSSAPSRVNLRMEDVLPTGFREVTGLGNVAFDERGPPGLATRVAKNRHGSGVQSCTGRMRRATKALVDTPVLAEQRTWVLSSQPISNITHNTQ